MKYIIYTIIFILLAIFANGAIIYSANDADVSDNLPNNNFNGNPDYAQSKAPTNNYRTYQEFNLGFNPDIFIAEANYTFHIDGISAKNGPVFNIDFYLCNDGFNEAVLTWNNQLAEIQNCNATPFMSYGLMNYSSHNYYTYNVTDFIKENDNGLFTFKIKASIEDYNASALWIGINSSETPALTGRPIISYRNITDNTAPLIQNIICNNPKFPDIAEPYWTNRNKTNYTLDTNENSICYINGSICNITGNLNHTCIIINPLNDGYANIKINCTDSFQNENITFIQSYIDTIPPAISFNSPESQTFNNRLWVLLNVTAYDKTNVNNISLYINNILNFTNTTPLNNSEWIYNLTFFNYSNYTIQFYAWDNVTDYNIGESVIRWLNFKYISNAAEEENITEFNINIILIVAFLIYGFILAFGIIFQNYYAVMISAIYGFVFGIWLFTNNFPGYLTAVFSIWNAYLFFGIVSK